MLTVSNYHYIRESYATKYPSIFGVTPLQFEKQLKLFKNEGDFIKTSELESNFDEIIHSKNNYFLITFDDGLQEQYQYGLPIMSDLGAEGYFFVNAVNLKEKRVSTVHKIHLLRSILNPSLLLNEMLELSKYDFTKAAQNRAVAMYRYDNEKSAHLKYFLNILMPFELKETAIAALFSVHFNEQDIVNSLYMTEEEIIHLAKLNFLGDHTYNHYPLAQLSTAEMIFELSESKLYLEELTNHKMHTISYPYGFKEACNEEVAELAKKLDYQLGFTTDRGVNKGNENRLLLNRFDCNDLIGGKSYDS